MELWIVVKDVEVVSIHNDEPDAISAAVKIEGSEVKRVEV